MNYQKFIGIFNIFSDKPMIEFFSIAIFVAACVIPGTYGNYNQLAANLTVFGYLPEYRYSNFDYENTFRLGVTHLIFFSLEVDPKTSTPAALDRLPSMNDVVRARNAANKYGAKLLLSFGGNARSKGFDTMTATVKRRTRFLSSLNKILIEYGMDGVDYNWEYPASEKEWENWNKLLKQSKLQLLQNDKTINDGQQRQNIVTFTMYADKNHFNIVKKHKLLENADYLHCMVYDSRNKHSTIQFAKAAVQMAKDTFQDGIDPKEKKLISKWTLGVPFYGRDVHTGEAAAYYDLVKREFMQQQALVPLPACVSTVSDASLIDIADNDTRDLIDKQMFYNSPLTLRMKTNLAIVNGIGGIMIWELGQDVQPFGERSLLAAVGCGPVPPTNSILAKNSANIGDEGDNEEL